MPEAYIVPMELEVSILFGLKGREVGGIYYRQPEDRTSFALLFEDCLNRQFLLYFTFFFEIYRSRKATMTTMVTKNTVCSPT